MRPHNVRNALAESVFSFLHKDGADVEYKHRSPSDPVGGGTIKKRRPREEEITVDYFPQTWGSTALGFGGMGGASMTTAYTTVIYMGGLSYVYFGGMFCYAVESDVDLAGHVNKRNMPSIIDKKMDSLRIIKTYKTT